MEYKIGDLSYLFNLSAESLRQYERQGIVHPHKKVDSTYRYYSAWDMAVLSACRQYRALGFSLEESSQMIREKDPVNVFNSLRERECIIENEIARQCTLLRTVRAWRKEAEETASLVGKFELSENVSTYFLPYQYGDSLVTAKEHLECVRNWLAYIPYVYIGMIVPHHSAISDITVGLSMAEVGVQQLNPPWHSSLINIPSRLCVHTAFQLQNNALDSRRLQNILQEWASTQNMCLKGDMFCRFNLITWGEEGLGGVLDCFQPVE